MSDVFTICQAVDEQVEFDPQIVDSVFIPEDWIVRFFVVGSVDSLLTARAEFFSIVFDVRVEVCPLGEKSNG